MTDPKRDLFQHRQAWTVCNVLSFYGYPDEHREALRRIAATPEFEASVIAESMVKMERGADRQLARVFAEANTNLVLVATKILDDLEADCRAKDLTGETNR